MYRSIADFTQDWEYERGMTRKLLDGLTEESLSQAVRPGGRTLGKLAEHLIHRLVEMPDASMPEQCSETAENPGAAVAAQWTDAALDEDVRMYGRVWRRGIVLRALINHEAHHRGQMTVLMRQAGLRVPGIHGPAEEDRASIGMPAQE
jgi:uncharacterized damage-inducible protein DinB